MIENGKVLEVTISPNGSELIAAAGIGVSTLTVEDAYDFSEDGGSLELNGVVLAYNSIDLDNNVITLSDPIASAAVESDFVYVYPRGATKFAMVDFEDSEEGIRAMVPFHMHDRFDDGIRDIAEQEAVLVSDETGRWEIVAVDDEIPQIKGSYVTEEGLPGVGTDGLVPAVSPDVTIDSLGYTGIMIRWPAVSNPDPVRYRIFLDSVNPPVQAFDDTAGLMLATSVLPDGTPLGVGGTYYAQALALDDDGPAVSKGAVDSGGPVVVPADAVHEDILVANEIFSREGYFGTISADQIATGELIAALAIVGGLSVGPGITITPDNGIEIITVNGTTQFPTDGGSIKLQAEVVAAALEVIGAFVIRGTDNEIAKGATVEIASGVTTPKLSPQLSSVYVTTDAWQPSSVGAVNTGFSFHSTQNRWLTVETGTGSVKLKQLSVDGSGNYIDAGQDWDLAVNGGLSEVIGGRGGIVVVGDNAYILCQTSEYWSTGSPGSFDDIVGRWWVYKLAYNSSWTNNANRWTYVTRWAYYASGETTELSILSPYDPAIGYDNVNVVVCQAAKTTGRNYLTAFNPTTGSRGGPVSLLQEDGSTVFVNARHCRGVISGTFDNGVDGYQITHEGHATQHWFDRTTKIREQDREFPSSGTSNKGMYWNGTRFLMLVANKVVQHSQIKDVSFTASPINAVQSWRLADAVSPDFAAAETLPGPRAQYTALPRRAWLKVASQVAIPNDPADINDPDSLTFYIARGTGTPANSAYHRVSPPAVGVTEQILDLLPTVGGNPLTVSTFVASGSTPAEFRSSATDSIGNVISLKGSGAGRAGPLFWGDSGELTDDSDPGWTNMTLNGANAGTGTARWRALKLGSFKIVCVMLLTSGASVSAGTALTVVTSGNGIPSAYRPTVAALSGARITAGGVAGVLIVNTDGSIQVHSDTSGGLIQSTCTYIV